MYLRQFENSCLKYKMNSHQELALAKICEEKFKSIAVVIEIKKERRDQDMWEIMLFYCGAENSYIVAKDLTLCE